MRQIHIYISSNSKVFFFFCDMHAFHLYWKDQNLIQIQITHTYLKTNSVNASITSSISDKPDQEWTAAVPSCSTAAQARGNQFPTEHAAPNCHANTTARQGLPHSCIKKVHIPLCLCSHKFAKMIVNCTSLCCRRKRQRKKSIEGAQQASST